MESERKGLSESNQVTALLDAIMQNSATGMAVASGPELVVRITNPAYQALVPAQAPRVIGARLGELWPPAMGMDFEQLARRVIQQNKSHFIRRLELRFPDGLIHSYSARLCPLVWQNEDGALILLHETTETDRARHHAMEVAEATFHRAQELDAVFEAMADAVIILDRKGKVKRANPAAATLLDAIPVGVDLSDLVMATGARYLDGSPVMQGDLPFERALNGEIITGEQLLIEKDEDEMVVRISASPLFNSTYISGVITVWHDVTERERLLEQLEIEQSRLETIIENAPEAIVVADEEGRIVLGNPAAEAIFGRQLPFGQDFTSQVGLSIHYNNGKPYDPRNLPLTCSALDGERLNNIELQVYLPDGHIRYIAASTAPIVDRKGNLNGAVGIFQDITRRKQAEEALRIQAARSQLLAMLSQQFDQAGLNWHDLLHTITLQVGKTLGHLCSLHLFSEDNQEQYLAAISLDEPQGFAFINDSIRGVRFSTSQGLIGTILRTGQPLMLNNLSSTEVTNSIPDVDWSAAGLRIPRKVHVLMVPLRAHGRWVGVINLMRFQPGPYFQEEDQAFLQDLAERAALAIENARLYEKEAQRAREMAALHHAASALLTTLDLETLLEEILNSAQNAIPAAQYGMIYLLSEKTGQLDPRAANGAYTTDMSCTGIQNLATEAVREKRPLLSAMEEFPQVPLTGAPHGSYSAIAAPLMQPHKVFGALVLFGVQSGLFSTEDLNLLDSFAATATAALQNATLYAEVQRLATTDTLTEQFNRRRFLELSELEIYRARRFSTPLSAIMFDLDNFKEVNDTHGHAVGDFVLRAVAQRCQASIRVIDILGRYGGDEFAILLPDADMDEAQEIAERIRHTVTRDPICTGSAEIRLTISLGVAKFYQESESLASLLGRADNALYTAKQHGRNQVAKA